MARTDKNLQRVDNSDQAAGLILNEQTGAPLPGVGFASAERRAQVIAEGTVARQFVQFAEGMALEGIVKGEGSPVDVKSPDGEMSPERTWNLDVGGGITIGVLGSHQLNSELPAYIGKRVYIEKGAAKSVGSRRVNTYLIVDLTPKA